MDRPEHAVILLVEDNEGDIVIAEYAMRQAKLVNRMMIARDGDEALDVLFKRNGFEDAATPDLILLDLNLPKTDGFEVLETIKSDKILLRIPVVVLTSSSADIDRIKSYDLHANCFVSKPVRSSDFVHVVQEIEAFWFSIVKLGPKSDRH
ncbi:response regulator [Donghicola eburneus]|uniref:response regulator n=1 Tax=Donghicola eburneus TaxID=393278 RepID=UPI0008F42BD1|nr:response regulator [Donghicola eburneus]SFQ78308.1 Response regulator receiver domain-containing protein [Donghicola eburneus]